ncbi:MAG: hypothetical protein FD153_1308 [Rhodospirillaceae bacterium]|nr:MAG: hypothetical protein FD153_1308 [Rhodospirillaceae bacterium]
MHDLMIRLSTAEEFLTFFAILFDQRVVDVYRLHILKRFGAAKAHASLSSRRRGK